MTLDRIFKCVSAKLLDTLLANPQRAFTKEQLCVRSKVASRSMERWMPILVQQGLVFKKRDIAGKVCYAFNLKSAGAIALSRIPLGEEDQ